MNFKAKLGIFLGGVFLALCGAEIPENLFPDQSFRSWEATAERRFTANGGENGAPALIVERTNPDVFDFKMEKIQYPMKPNSRYEITYRVKGKNVSPLKLGAGVWMVFWKKGRWAGEFTRRGLYGSSDWKTFRFELTTPKDFDSAYIGFYMGMPSKQPKNQLGYAVFCRPVLRELKPIWNVDLLNPPLHHGLRTGPNQLVFTHAVIGQLDKLPEYLTAECKGATQFTQKVPVKDGRFVVKADLKKGDFTLTLRYGPFTKVFELSAGREMPANGVWIDERGRVIRNGKPFLPVVIYDNHCAPTLKEFGYVVTEEDIRLFLESPFTSMGLDSLWRTRFEGEQDGTRWGKLTRKTLDNALKLMDRFHAAGKTMLTPARPIHAKSKMLGATGIMDVSKLLIRTFSKHPAHLMWYFNDETDMSADELAKRELFAQLDPFHPTLQVQYKVEAYGECIGATDLFGMDNYPIFNENSTLEIVAKAMDAMQKHFSWNGHISCWAVPQIFNWNNYDKTAPYYFPAEEQIRGNVILMALSGVKGYYMYHRQCLREGVDHAGYLKRWEMVCRVAQMLRDLEPYLLSSQDHPKFEMKVLKGQVRAQTFRTDDGRLALLVANVGKGEGEAEITFPGSESLRSLYGLTKQENGKWIFKGKNIAGDVIK
ncbi:MAG: hypothetical protein J5858_13355 [Lentisphaeria bacterium]|nr:hypothetical protein [Lentisphaeria bacterium]